MKRGAPGSGTRISARWVHVAAACFLTLAPTRGFAQSSPAGGPVRPPPVEAAGAIDAGREAAALYHERRYADAYERFALADRLTHSPVFVLFMARCARNLGRLLEARTLFRRAAEEPLPDGATEPMRAAQTQARVELADVERRTPVLTVSVDPPTARVTIDDRPVSPGKLELDPGSHRVVATFRNGRSLERSVQLVEGGAEQTLFLSPPPAESDRSGRKQGPLWPGVVTLGTGVALVAVGAVFGATALMKTNDLRSTCAGGTRCQPEQQPEADSAQSAANVSTVTFIVGGVLSALGVGLLIVRPFGSTPARGSTAAARVVF